MPEEKPKPSTRPAPPKTPSPPARPVVPGPVGPFIPPYRGPGRIAGNLAPASRWAARPHPVPIAAHTATGPAWTCDACGDDWPCPALRAVPTDAARRATLIPEFSRITRRAIRDLRGRPGGPDPVAIVRRFLWFLPLTEAEARAVALRLR
ncbi:Maf family protein [Micromonospora auratinigra]|uniref:Uncharacterized protein n=1 Tax=Micromonospora auratinigra TaxID=261654 RepID=A0A1A9A1S6_9ACTN|nr:hypothetical protein [Micromonospora auratinigra]SBT50093.1 hypothetical protein GA0070611_4656 [Micromonospora auratinigra]